MISRTTDALGLKAVMDDTPALTHVMCDMSEWIEDDRNVALEEDGSFGVFEWNYPGVYTGHYFFRVRGKDAKELAIRMLRVAFEEHGMQVVRGLTPTHHKPAAYMTRHLGFTEHGVVETLAGPCYIFTLTSEEFKDKYK